MSWNELLLRRLPLAIPRLRPPRMALRFLNAKLSPAASLWLQRNEIDEGMLRKGGWNLLLFSSIVSATILAILLIAGGGTGIYGLFPCLIAPLVVASLYMNMPERHAAAMERRMLREAPSILGSITMSMQVSPSLEEAVAFASDRGKGVLAQRLREARWSNLTRLKGSLNEALEELASSLTDTNQSLRQAIHLAVASTSERTKEGMDRLLDKANMVVLKGVRDAVETYVASLSLPTMVLFSLGTLLPIMLFSILPLLSVGGSAGSSGTALPFPYLALLLVAVIPISSVCYSWSILSKNPLGMIEPSEGSKDLFRLPFIAAWVLAVVVAATIGQGDMSPYLVSGAIIITPCAYAGWKLRQRPSSSKRWSTLEKEGAAALFQIGNRMLSGTTLESALGEVTAGRKNDFSEVARLLLHRSKLSGESFDSIIMAEGSLGRASSDLENAFVTVARCAVRDPVYAGQVAMNMAHMLSDLQACRGKVEERLRGVIEMMRSTSTFFAPIVLAVTGALFALIGTRAGDAGTTANDIILISGVYIGELSFLVSFFTVLLLGERSWKGVTYHYAIRTPVAFGVFVVVSIICRTGLTALL